MKLNFLIFLISPQVIYCSWNLNVNTVLGLSLSGVSTVKTLRTETLRGFRVTFKVWGVSLFNKWSHDYIISWGGVNSPRWPPCSSLVLDAALPKHKQTSSEQTEQRSQSWNPFSRNPHWSFLLTGITFTSVWTSDSLYYFIYVLWILTRQIPVWTKLIGPCIITEPQPALKQVYLSGQLFWPLSVICGQWLERITTLSI